MRSLAFAAAAFWLCLLPSTALAEVCLRGSSDDVHTPFLHGCDPHFRFEESFGTKGVFVNDLPSISASASGRPQVGVRLEYDGLVDVLEASSKGGDKSLESAVSQFELAVREIACAGNYTDFLQAGGSLRIVFTALRKTEEQEVLSWGLERFSLFDMEIDTIKDCEAN
jgi:hypothetical protein